MPKEKIVQIVKGANGVRYLVERPSMTHQEKLAAIRAKCIEANPSIKSRLHASRDGALRCRNCGEPDNYENHGKCEKGEERPIRLTDVLLAVDAATEDRNEWELSIKSNGVFMMRDEDFGCRWNLLKPFEDQDEPTISFLYNILN